ncbi:hypothetical protein HHL11_10505 [Ramlibacter sp. G-1-2-2]|uniref:DoxX family protein n=1 Tax=Ramlibacter agri TaxID=2728837 RepID=A0A848H396_9BURK|nr:hypothetical protein [Ramlibacter agri]NML44182.1 hypothetical protein [Ramlibacter agri]
MHNPYQPSAASLEIQPPAPKPAPEFPFAMVVRWIASTLVIAYGILRLVNLANGWSWLADRAVIDTLSNPWIRLAAESCVLLTGLLLLLRSKFVFLPLAGHIALILWFVFGFGPVGRLPAAVFIVWAVQSALLGFSLWLLLKQRLR